MERFLMNYDEKENMRWSDVRRDKMGYATILPRREGQNKYEIRLDETKDNTKWITWWDEIEYSIS